MNDNSGSFDFGSAFDPEPAPRGGSRPGPQPPSSVFDPTFGQPPAPINPTIYDPNFGRPTTPSFAPAPHIGSTLLPSPTRRGQPLAWLSIGLAAASALTIGTGLYLALDSIELPVGSAIDDAKSWLNLVVAGLCLGLVAVAVSVVALVRSRPRTVATFGLVAALILPPIAAIIGFKLGADSLTEHLRDAGDEATNILAAGLSQYADSGAGDLISVLLNILRLIRGD